MSREAPTEAAIGPSSEPTPSPEPTATDEPGATDLPATHLPATHAPVTTRPPARPTPTPGDGPWWLGGGSGPCGVGAAPYGCAGELEQGTHTSAGFVPAITYDVIPGWVNVSDWPFRFVLIQDTAENREALANGDDPRVSITILRLDEADPSCTDSRPPTAFTTYEIATWLGGHQEETTFVAPLTVGGLPGHRVDLEVRPKLGEMCVGDVPQLRPVVTDRYRVIVLETPGGSRLAIQIKVPGFGRFDMFLAESAPIIESLEFADDS